MKINARKLHWKKTTAWSESRKVEEKKYWALRPVGDEKKSHPAGAPETNPYFFGHLTIFNHLLLELFTRFSKIFLQPSTGVAHAYSALCGQVIGIIQFSYDLPVNFAWISEKQNDKKENKNSKIWQNSKKKNLPKLALTLSTINNCVTVNPEHVWRTKIIQTQLVLKLNINNNTNNIHKENAKHPTKRREFLFHSPPLPSLCNHNVHESYNRDIPAKCPGGLLKFYRGCIS